MVELTSDLDLNQVKSKLGQYPRLSHNDDLKLDWDDKVNKYGSVASCGILVGFLFLVRFG